MMNEVDSNIEHGRFGLHWMSPNYIPADVLYSQRQLKVDTTNKL